MISALSARAVQPLVVALRIAFLSMPPLATAQSNLGEALDAGATRVSAEEFRRDVVQRTIIGVTPTGGIFEIVFTGNGAISGAGTASRYSPVQTGISGEWRIDDRDRICTSMRAASGQIGGGPQQSPSLNLPTRCQFWFKAGEQYLLSDSDSDRQERVAQRAVKPTIASYTVSTPGAQLTLPRSLKGLATYRYGGAVGTSGWSLAPWSLAVTKTNDDGTFEGLVSFGGSNLAGRRCFADKAPVTAGLVKDGEVRFELSMGPQCNENTFTLRRGKEHFLEGALVNKNVSEPAQVWLDLDQ